MYPGQLEYFGGLTATPIEHVSILDAWLESVADEKLSVDDNLSFDDDLSADDGLSADDDLSADERASPDPVDVKEEHRDEINDLELLNAIEQDSVEQERQLNFGELVILMTVI